MRKILNREQTYVFNFEKPVVIVGWVGNIRYAELPAIDALVVMSRSTRFDDAHATANVRLLHRADEALYEIEHNTPVTFQQA